MLADKKAVLMSLKPRWCSMILNGEKVREVRKRAPLLRQPFKVYLYCTKGKELYVARDKDRKIAYTMNGKVCGEATCVSITEYSRPFPVPGTCLSVQELERYAGGNENLSYMVLENPVIYERPKELADFGVKYAPQSWQFVEEIEDED